MSSGVDFIDECAQAQDTICVYTACILIQRRGSRCVSNSAQSALHALCQRTSRRVEMIELRREWGALLDLGRCSEDEAHAACAALSARLARRGFDARVGVGPTITLARLAALTPAPDAIHLITPASRATFLPGISVDWLTRLEPASMTPALIARLHHFGLRTLGQLTWLTARDSHTLLRQFGHAGAALATLAQGEDLRPLQPTALPASVTARQRFSPAATLNEALACLPGLTRRIAWRLQEHDPKGKWRDRQGHDLRLRIAWDMGGASLARRRLARPHYLSGELARAAQALLAAHMESLESMRKTIHSAPLDRGDPTAAAADDGEDGECVMLVTEVRVTLGDLATRQCAQLAKLFDVTPAFAARATIQERLSRIIADVGEPLTRRYGSPALYQLISDQPHAIFPEERSRLISVPQSTIDRRDERKRESQRQGRLSSLTRGRARAPQPHWW
jgi:hypothetical protein